MEDGCGGCVIEGCVLCGIVCSGCHVVPGRALIGSDEDSGGLSRPDHDDIGGEGLDVGRVHTHNGHLVVGNRIEELLIECRVDDSQENCFSRFDIENYGLCSRTKSNQYV